MNKRTTRGGYGLTRVKDIMTKETLYCTVS